MPCLFITFYLQSTTTTTIKKVIFEKHAQCGDFLIIKNHFFHPYVRLKLPLNDEQKYIYI